jgi:hypothetical protein
MSAGVCGVFAPPQSKVEECETRTQGEGGAASTKLATRSATTRA